VLGGCGGGDPAPRGPVLHVSPAGSDSAPCTAAQPCRTLRRAFGQARPGAEIRLGAGRYPDQLVQGRGGTRSAPVVIRPDRGARVRVGVLDLRAHGLEIQGLHLAGWHALEGSGELTFRDVHTGWFFVDSVSRLRILGGTVGPADSVDSQIRAAGPASPAPRHVLIDGVTFRDFTARRDPSQHVECLQFGAGEHVVVRRSRFFNCATHSIFINAWGGARIRDFTFEDNRFGRVPDGYYSLRVGRGDPGSTSDIKVRNNSATVTMQVDDGIPGVSFVGNLAPRSPWECFSDQRYAGNVWSDTRCGTTDRQAGEGAVAQAAADPSRRPGAAALPAG
jgi:hypothetical protein